MMLCHKIKLLDNYILEVFILNNRAMFRINNVTNTLKAQTVEYKDFKKKLKTFVEENNLYVLDKNHYKELIS